MILHLQHLLQTLQLKDVKTMKNQLKAGVHMDTHTHMHTHTHTHGKALYGGLHLMGFLIPHTLVRCFSKRPDKFTAETELTHLYYLNSFVGNFVLMKVAWATLIFTNNRKLMNNIPHEQKNCHCLFEGSRGHQPRCTPLLLNPTS